MTTNLLLTALIIISCLVLNRVSNKLGIPMLLAFIVLGMFFGSDGLLKIPFDNFFMAEELCSIALIFIMFYGGFGTKLSQARPILVKSVLLSTLGVLMTAALVGLFCHFVLRFPLFESFLIGSVLSSTDAASVFSILRSKKLNLKYNTASMLEVESGSNDPCAYMLTVIILTLMGGQETQINLFGLVFAQIFYGVIFGIGIAYLALWIYKRFEFKESGYTAIFMVAIALTAFALPVQFGGNGYLSVYIVGVMMGNKRIQGKKALVNFFDGITGLMQMFLFFLLGLLSYPSQMLTILAPAIAIALFLTFVARPVTIFAILSPFGCELSQKLLVSWSGLRGAASIVFAVTATISPAYTSNDIFHIVFQIVLFSILFQGSLIPFIARKLNMIDAHEDVMKTFTDYSDEVPIEFIEFTINETHQWAGKYIREILLPPDTILVLILRNREELIPRGNIKLEVEDTLILSAKSPRKIDGIALYETTVGATHEWRDHKVKDLVKDPAMLIVHIRRKGRVVIPVGDTVIKSGDVLVMNRRD